ncbi:MAG TPA: 4Fe-4S dicluster domain-containing protein [Deltaproteobacteria bacterium]|nr:4Fe-4S dicluster domain-containing protein [Deltaproteobacteria bacterium]
MSYRITQACNGCGACKKICPVEAIEGNKKELHVIDEAVCIECGVCGRVCPHNAVLDQFGKQCLMMKRSQWKKPRFDNSACMSCNICIDACPVSCLALSEPVDREKYPHGRPYIREEKACIACGFCAEECPVDAVSMI